MNRHLDKKAPTSRRVEVYQKTCCNNRCVSFR